MTRRPAQEIAGHGYRLASVLRAFRDRASAAVICLLLATFAGSAVFGADPAQSRRFSQRDGTGPLRIAADYGGSIAAYMRDVDLLRDERRRVEILGDCRSACTLYLGAGEVCVAREARLRFHGPSRPDVALSEAQFEGFSRQMAAYYPEPIRSWFLTRARYRTEGTFLLTGAALIAMGVPEC